MAKDIEKLMALLNISEAEAVEMLADDLRIDRGEKLFELDPELEKGAKKARQADRKPTERKPREKRVDEEKQAIIQALIFGIGNAPLLDAEIHTFEILNPEREFLFTHNGRKFKVTLSCPRN